MQIVGCGKGHYYNPELYSSCPECAKENGNKELSCSPDSPFIMDDANKFSEISVMELLDIHNAANKFSDITPAAFLDFDDSANTSEELSVTEPVDFRGFDSTPGAIGATEPVSFHGFDDKPGEIGITEPAVFHDFSCRSEICATEPVVRDVFVDAPSQFSASADVSHNRNAQDYSVTMPVIPAGMDSKTSDGAPFMPVVGWLVCIEGFAKGQDYRIHSHYNFIGRASNMDICISGDECISADKAAVIAYDPEENYYSFGPGTGHNVVRVNGKMLMNAVVLNAYDELTIGKTKLLFVPLCGEQFCWGSK